DGATSALAEDREHDVCAGIDGVCRAGRRQSERQSQSLFQPLEECAPFSTAIADLSRDTEWRRTSGILSVKDSTARHRSHLYRSTRDLDSASAFISSVSSAVGPARSIGSRTR